MCKPDVTLGIRQQENVERQLDSEIQKAWGGRCKDHIYQVFNVYYVAYKRLFWESTKKLLSVKSQQVTEVKTYLHSRLI